MYVDHAGYRPLNRVFVTGLGVTSPLGPETNANVRSLRDGQDSVTPVGSFDVTKTRCKTAGQVPDDWLEDGFPTGRVTRRLHRGARMAALALREACESAKGANLELIVVGTTGGGMSYGSFESVGALWGNFVRDYLLETYENMLSFRTLNAYYPHLSLGPGQRFASKGGYIVHFADAAGTRIVQDGEWIVP